MEDASLEYKDGVSTFTANVYNESGDVYNLKTINVILDYLQKKRLIVFIDTKLYQF